MPLFRRTPKRSVPDPRFQPDPTAGDPRARAVLEATDTGDLNGLREAAGGLRSAYEREFYSGLMTQFPEPPPILDEWVEAEPSSSLPYLFRGAQRTEWAWVARGNGHADHVRLEQWEAFFARLRAAEHDLLRAHDLDPDDAAAWSGLVITGMGLLIPQEELRLRYDQAERLAPGMIDLHHTMVIALSAKWGGSDEAMFAFARSAATGAPVGSFLHALVIEAHIEKWADDRDHFANPDHRAEVLASARQSVLHADWVDTPHGASTANVVAVALWVGGQRELATELVRRIMPRFTENPWDLLDPDSAAAIARVATG